jgi:hypothetical protein
MWNLILVHLEIVLVSVQDKCTVCAERSIGSKIILDAPDVTTTDAGHVQPSFGLFGDIVSVTAR